MKRNLCLVLALSLVFLFIAGCDGGKKETLEIGMITDTGGLGDQSFNDSAYAGLKKAEEEFDIKVSVLESESADDYKPNLSSFAEEDYDLVLGVGFLFEAAMKEAAESYPDTKFAIIDGFIPDMDNVVSLNFAEEEAAFLIGVIAGSATESNTLGFIGGMEFPLIKKFEFGFKAGVKTVNPNVEIITNYAGSFEDSAMGKEIALVQYEKGADIIFHAAGGVGIGMINAAKEKGFWAIGVDQDQSALAPENVLCSMIKRVDTATYYATKQVVEEKFEGGSNVYDLAIEGVGYSDDAGNLTDDLIDIAEKWKKAIIDGSFSVPATEEEFNAFEVPEI